MKFRYGKCNSLYISKGVYYIDGLLWGQAEAISEAPYMTVNRLKEGFYHWVSVSCNDNGKETLAAARKVLRYAEKSGVQDSIFTNCNLQSEFRIKNYCDLKIQTGCNCLK